VWSPDGLARDGWRAVARRPASRGRLKAPAEGFLRVVTINILFICGGAFSGSERIIGACGKGNGFGHGAKVCSPDERRMGAILREVERAALVRPRPGRYRGLRKH